MQEYCIMGQKTPKPEKEFCAVFMPFDHRFDPVYGAISMALQGKIELERADRKYRGREWFQNILPLIKGAKIILAVCSGDENESHPNSNVVYEVGWAHALNKATMILYTDRTTLPAMLTEYLTFKYDPYKLDDCTFGGPLRDKVNQLYDATKKTLIDTTVPGAIFVDGNKVFLFEDKLITDCRTVHNFSMELNTHLDTISSYLATIYHTDNFRKKDNSTIEVLVEQFKTFCKDIEKVQPFFAARNMPSDADTTNVSDALSRLRDNFSHMQTRVKHCQQCWYNVCKYINDINQGLNRLSAIGVGSAKEWRIAHKLLDTRMNELAQALRSVNSNLLELMSDLVKMASQS